MWPWCPRRTKEGARVTPLAHFMELELQLVANAHVSAGNVFLLCKSSKCLAKALSPDQLKVLKKNHLCMWVWAWMCACLGVCGDARGHLSSCPFCSIEGFCLPWAYLKECSYFKKKICLSSLYYDKKYGIYNLFLHYGFQNRLQFNMLKIYLFLVNLIRFL